MSKILSYRSLIQGIEKVYFKISLIVLHRRMDSYSKNVSHAHADDIESPLAECADTFISDNQDNREVIHTLDCTIHESASTNWHSHEKRQTGHHQILVNRRFRYVGDLSKYFKARNRGSGLHPGIKEKLELSVWEHIHATIRCARDGDERTTKMHVNIASTACKELEHYMDEKEYQAFISNAKKHLGSLSISTTNC